MRRVALLAVAVLSLAGTAALHLRVEARDGGWLLLVDGVPRDPIGAASEAWLRLRRDCSTVDTLRPGDADWQAAERVVAEYSPPDSRSARLRRLQASGEWRLAEAGFDVLEPAVLLLRRDADGLRVREGAIWSGSTRPWNHGAFVRRYLAARAPEAPAGLLDCYEPAPAPQRPAPPPSTSGLP